MKIWLNLLYLLPGVVVGTETYARGLLRGFEKIDQSDEFFIFMNRTASGWKMPRAGNFKKITCPVSGVSRTNRFLYEQAIFPFLLKKYKIDVVHSLGYVSPLMTHCPAVVSIPDLNYVALGRQMKTVRRLSLGLFVRCSAMRSDRIITLSGYSRNQIVSAFNLDRNKVEIIHLAPFDLSDEACDRSHGIRVSGFPSDKPYIIAFSGMSPHKNIIRLLRAYSIARGKGNLQHNLILVGHEPADLSAVSHDVSELMKCGNIVFTGYLDRSTVMDVLKKSSFLIFPSIYEGFGLPVVEAMALGVPVVVSNRASLPEIAGDAAIFINPESEDDMVEKIRKVAEDSRIRSKLKELGRKNVLRFSWEETARKTLDVYKQVQGQ